MIYLLHCCNDTEIRYFNFESYQVIKHFSLRMVKGSRFSFVQLYKIPKKILPKLTYSKRDLIKTLKMKEVQAFTLKDTTIFK